MNEFKIGDSVKFKIEEPPLMRKLFNGKEGIIVAIKSGMCQVIHNGHKGSLTLSAENLELVTSSEEKADWDE